MHGSAPSANTPHVDSFELLSVVRVRRLLRAADDYDGWGRNLRQPRPGDVGTIVDILLGVRYVVEFVNDGGVTEWLSELSAEELESVAS